MTFPLLDLPRVPMANILRFMSNADLTKMQQTCRLMRNLVVQNRLKRRSTQVTVSRSVQGEEFVYKIHAWGRCRPHWFTPVENAHLMEYRWNKSCPSSLPFFFWFAETFSKTTIAKVYLAEFHFNEEEMDNVREFWRRHGLLLRELNILNCTYGQPRNVARLLSAVSPEKAILRPADVIRYEDSAAIQLRNTLQNLLPSCEFDFQYVVDFKIIKEKIHNWWYNRVPFGKFTFHLPLDFYNNERMVREIGLPEVKTTICKKDGTIKLWREFNRSPDCISIDRNENFAKLSNSIEWQFS